MELLIIGALGMAAGAGGVLASQLVRRNGERKLAEHIRQTILKCFAKSGLEIVVSCIREKDGYVVCIESEPSKKLRFSYIKEQALAQHIERTTGQAISRMFWRFRMKNPEGQNVPLGAEAMPASLANNSTERAPMRADAEYQVDEVAWDSFADYVHANQNPEITQTQFNRIVARGAA
jgi:hypothetical protein